MSRKQEGKGKSQPIALAMQKNGPSCQVFFIASLDHFASRVGKERWEARTDDVVGGGRECSGHDLNLDSATTHTIQYNNSRPTHCSPTRAHFSKRVEVDRLLIPKIRKSGLLPLLAIGNQKETKNQFSSPSFTSNRGS